MSGFVEKRKCRRFEIYGAKVSYKKTGLFGFFRTLSDECPLLNLSKGGLGFLCREKLRIGEKIIVVLLAPNESPLGLLGHVRWQERLITAGEAATGVAFMPFSRRIGWNPIEALDMLRRLDEEYGEEEKTI